MIGFKLRVMRLNRVESFYMFLLRFRNEGSEEQGRPATASPHAGLATHGQPPCRAGHPRPGRVQDLPAAARASPQGGPAAPAGAVARRGDAGKHECSARKGLPPAASPISNRGAMPATEVAAPWQGGYRCAKAVAACAEATTTA
ncbi:hypothetical protein BHM03_00047441 [Ensete ventricosum]|nr:hypothetical protein BHM03_00047441 [Ensete ventricosum]